MSIIGDIPFVPKSQVEQALESAELPEIKWRPLVPLADRIGEAIKEKDGALLFMHPYGRKALLYSCKTPLDFDASGMEDQYCGCPVRVSADMPWDMVVITDAVHRTLAVIIVDDADLQQTVQAVQAVPELPPLCRSQGQSGTQSQSSGTSQKL